MKCPKCHEEMEEGVFRMRATALGFLAYGFSAQDLYFQDDHDQVEVKVLRRSGRADGFRCDPCAVSVIVEGW